MDLHRPNLHKIGVGKKRGHQVFNHKFELLKNPAHSQPFVLFANEGTLD